MSLAHVTTLEWPLAFRTGLYFSVFAAIIAGFGAHAGPYGELGGGMFMLDEMSGVSDRFDGFAADLTYGLTNGLALEGGMRAIADTPFGVGIGLQGFRTVVDEAVLVNPPQTLLIAQSPGDVTDSPVKLTSGGIVDLGINFDHRVTILSASGFYDMGDEEGLVLYLGVGFGVASIGDEIKTGPLVHLGARYTVVPIGYVSLRATRFQSDGPKDDAGGLKFDRFAATGVTVSFGFEF